MKKTTRFCIHLMAVISVLCALFAFPDTAAAFHGGYHYDLTRDCLVKENFGQSAIELVQINNWYNDAFESSGKDGFEGFGSSIVFSGDELIHASDVYLHFDQLPDFEAVSDEWERLEINTYLAIDEAQDRGDAAGFLAALGISLHAVQDFYAHSNWAELDWGGDATWFDIHYLTKSALVETGQIEIYTHTGGSRSHDAINKDYALRAAQGLDFEGAYRDAFYASCQWIDRVQSWVSPGFWDTVRTYQDPNSADEWDWTKKLMLDVGTWKGKHSLNYDEILSTGSGYASSPHPVQIKWAEYAMKIAVPKRDGAVPAGDYTFIEGHNWLTIYTNRVRQTDCSTFNDIDYPGYADFYAKVKLDGHEYIEALYEDDDDITPSWITLMPLLPTRNTINLEYTIMDEDGGLRGPDGTCDIAYPRGASSWVYSGSPRVFREFEVSTDGLQSCSCWCIPIPFADDPCECDSNGDGDEAAATFLIRYDSNLQHVQIQRPPIVELPDQQIDISMILTAIAASAPTNAPTPAPPDVPGTIPTNPPISTPTTPGMSPAPSWNGILIISVIFVILILILLTIRRAKSRR